MAQFSFANYRSLLGDTKDTINAIQKFIEKDKEEKAANEMIEETPAASVNKIIQSTVDEETAETIQQIISKI